MQKARRQSYRRPKSPANLRPLVGTRFQGLFTRHLAFFSPFPHGTGALSVTREYLALEGGPPGFPQDYTCPTVLGILLGVVRLRVPGCHRLWRAVPGRFGLASCSHVAVPQPQPCKHDWFGLAPVRSPLLRGSRLLSLPPGTEMFQFPGLASRTCVRDDGLAAAGLPHSEILGSQLVCSSPRLIAAYHVLHRLSVPRHPPCALTRLIS